MTNITVLANELKTETAWQRTPDVVTDEDYLKMIVKAIKTLFIDTGRTFQYNNEMLVVENGETYFDYDLKIDEEKYVMLLAQISFFKKVQSDVNNIVSYTTDALSVTSADKPYTHLQNTISELENERRIVFYKMSRFVCLQN